MDYNSWWKWRDAIDQFPTLPDDKKQEILDTVLNRSHGTRMYYNDYVWAVNKLVEHVDVPTSLKLLSSCLSDKKDESMINIVTCLCKRGADQKVVKKMLTTATGDSARKALLCMPDITVDEEEIGLRAVSKAVHVPYALFENRYSPSLEALKRLPPIMRLDVLEGLTDRRNLPYNVFEKIQSGEEFKSLLFSAATKYLDRVNNMWEKYQESINKGILGIVTVKYFCKECGDIEIKIKSKMLHSKTSIRESRLHNLMTQWCPVCGHSNTEPSVSGEILE